MRALLIVSLSLGALAIGASIASAQDPIPAVPKVPSGFFVGGSLSVAQPQGEFAEYVDAGFGLSGHALYQLDPAGIFALRLEGGFVNYGSETKRVPLSPTIGGRVLVEVSTENNIAFLGIGPQLMVPNGRFRPYLNGYAGIAYFSTSSSVEGINGGESIGQTTNYDDATFSYGGGAGIYVPVRGGAEPISIDLGVRYRNNGEARYLREGSIQDNTDGTISFSPIESDTDLLDFHLGVSVGIGKLVRRMESQR